MLVSDYPNDSGRAKRRPRGRKIAAIRPFEFDECAWALGYVDGQRGKANPYPLYSNKWKSFNIGAADARLVLI
jgi:hypothetical protein